MTRQAIKKSKHDEKKKFIERLLNSVHEWMNLHEAYQIFRIFSEGHLNKRESTSRVDSAIELAATFSMGFIIDHEFGMLKR